MASKLKTLGPDNLPFCLSPIFNEIFLKYGTSYNNDEELPIITFDNLINEKYNDFKKFKQLQ